MYVNIQIILVVNEKEFTFEFTTDIVPYMVLAEKFCIQEKVFLGIEQGMENACIEQVYQALKEKEIIDF